MKQPVIFFLFLLLLAPGFLESTPVIIAEEWEKSPASHNLQTLPPQKIQHTVSRTYYNNRTNDHQMIINITLVDLELFSAAEQAEKIQDFERRLGHLLDIADNSRHFMGREFSPRNIGPLGKHWFTESELINHTAYSTCLTDQLVQEFQERNRSCSLIDEEYQAEMTKLLERLDLDIKNKVFSALNFQTKFPKPEHYKFPNGKFNHHDPDFVREYIRCAFLFVKLGTQVIQHARLLNLVWRQNKNKDGGIHYFGRGSEKIEMEVWLKQNKKEPVALGLFLNNLKNMDDVSWNKEDMRRLCWFLRSSSGSGSGSDSLNLTSSPEKVFTFVMNCDLHPQNTHCRVMNPANSSANMDEESQLRGLRLFVHTEEKALPNFQIVGFEQGKQFQLYPEDEENQGKKVPGRLQFLEKDYTNNVCPQGEIDSLADYLRNGKDTL